jgi:hypothetical protein
MAPSNKRAETTNDRVEEQDKEPGIVDKDHQNKEVTPEELTGADSVGSGDRVEKSIESKDDDKTDTNETDDYGNSAEGSAELSLNDKINKIKVDVQEALENEGYTDGDIEPVLSGFETIQLHLNSLLS